MRILEFTASKQRLTRTPTCDFSGLVAGSVGYLKAKFNFSPEWDGCKKAADFILKDASGALICGVLLNKDDTCVIPSDALVGSEFYVKVKGVKEGGRYQIETSEIRVKQEVNL